MSRIVTSVWSEQPTPGEGSVCKSCRYARPDDPRKTHRCARTKHAAGIYLPPHLHYVGGPESYRDSCSEHFPKSRPQPVVEPEMEAQPA